MKALVIYALETLASSGVLLALYSLLIERRVPFGWCRLYLLAAPLAGALIPLLRIPVWPAKVVVLPPMEALPVSGEWTPVLTPEPTVTPETVLGACYLAGMALLAGLMIAQIMRIRRLRRGASVTRTGRFTVVRTPQRIAPFSFLSSIYVWDETPDAETAAIVAHEASHIARGHTAERIVMECLKALLWWNPFVWIAARRLTETEEFEADSDVLRSGYDLQEYMHTIFRQVLGYSPDMANSLRDSLTKKRFQMMTTKISGRHSLLRMLATLPVFAGLLCAFSFTARASTIQAPAPVPADSARTIKVSMQVYKGGETLSGVVVRFDNTNKGTVTDTRGEANFEVPAGTVLELLYPGCEKRILKVPDTPRGEIAYALTMGEEKSADKTPFGKRLYLLDGMEINDLNSVDPGRIESIRVLTDEESARYGEKGRNGVILVTSKKIPPVTPRPAGATETAVFQDGAIRSEADDEPFLIAEVMPRFQGGDLNRFRAWVQQGIDYPVQAVNKGIEGRVILSFIVERDGSISNVNVLQTPDELLSKAACDKLAACPAGAWEPGMQRGKTVRVKYTIPVDFSLGKPEGAASASADIPAPAEQTDDNEVFLVVEQMPRFQGGDLITFRAWVQTQVRYPQQALQKRAEGRVVLTFIIERDGSVSNIHVLQSPDETLADETVRILRSSPAWTPGMQRGKTVRVKYTLPVDFRITGNNPQQTPKNPGDTPVTGDANTVDEITVISYGPETGK